MENIAEHRLEMLIMLPEALGSRAGGEWGKGVRPRTPGLKVEHHLRELYLREMYITLEERADVDAILEDLGALLGQDQSLDWLNVDVSRLVGLDHLSLSALVVVLREHCAPLAHITISGLPVWAQERLRLTGADNLLGRSWHGSFEPGAIRLCHGQGALEYR